MRVSVVTETSVPYILLEPDAVTGFLASGDAQDRARSAEQAADALPLVVCLHGRGSNAEDLAALGQALDQERYRYVVPNAPMVIDLGPWGGQGYQWYEIGPQQFEGIAASRRLLEDVLAYVWERYQTPRERTALMGFSQGAVMSLDVGLRSPAPFAAVVAMSGYLPLDDSLERALPAAQTRRLLVIHGTEDPLISIDLARAGVQALRKAGLSPIYKEYVMAHEVVGPELELIRSFLAETFG